jgi:hypothetical protein
MCQQQICIIVIIMLYDTCCVSTAWPTAQYFPHETGVISIVDLNLVGYNWGISTAFTLFSHISLACLARCLVVQFRLLCLMIAKWGI